MLGLRVLTYACVSRCEISHRRSKSMLRNRVAIFVLSSSRLVSFSSASTTNLSIIRTAFPCRNSLGCDSRHTLVDPSGIAGFRQRQANRTRKEMKNNWKAINKRLSQPSLSNMQALTRLCLLVPPRFMHNTCNNNKQLSTQDHW